MNVSEAVAPAGCPLCGASSAELIADIRRKPARETDFGVAPEGYRRVVYQCSACTVFFNVQQMIAPDIYVDGYNAATYDRNLYDVYTRIRALPAGKSDNKQRVQRVMDFNARAGRVPSETRVLDVGSGLCVFLAELKERGCLCYCIDPDERSARHAREHARVDATHVGTLEDFHPQERFDIISFNKVLEHLPDPLPALQRARTLLADGGCVYVELPDGEAALHNGGAVEREEFYIEHFTVFTPQSFALLIRSAGLRCAEMARIHEPSDKYTLYAFIVSPSLPSER